MTTFSHLRCRLWLGILLALLGALPAIALEPGRAMSEYGHRVWLSDSGLPQETVLCLLQTRDGYLWLCTSEGVVRFDGVRFTTFDHSNNPGLSIGAARTMYEDRQGGIWVGGNSGQVAHYKDGRFTAFPWNLGPANVLAILEDHEGAVWFGTDDGLFAYRDGQMQEIGSKQGVTVRQIWALAEDDHQRIWIGGADGGLFVWQNGKANPIPREQAGNSITCLAAHGNDVWVGGRPGLWLFHDGKPASFAAQAALKQESFSTLYADPNGYLWAGTRHTGIRRISPDGHVDAYGRTDGLSSDDVIALQGDTFGNLWIGTLGAGLNQLRNNFFQSLGQEQGLPGFVRTLVGDHQGDMWIATQSDGLFLVHEGKVGAYPGPRSLFLRGSFVDTDGSLWVGSADGTVYHQIGRNRFKEFTKADGFIGGSVKCFLRSRDGSLWIGTTFGVSRYRDGQFRNYTTSDGLAGKELGDILEARDGTLWFATNGGLSGFRNENFFASITDKDGLSSRQLRCLYEDADGAIWIGTRDSGLNRYKQGRITVYNQHVGLARDVVFSIIEDDAHNFWMSSTRGVFSVPKKQLDDYAEGRISAITSVAYGSADGMKAEECSGYALPAAWKARDGRIWYATVRGVAIIDPRRSPSGTVPPRAIVEEMRIDQQPVSLSSTELAVPPGRGELEFHYTAVDFLSPEKLQFKYRLLGYDRDWINAGTRREAFYTNLPPGRYRFQVSTLGGDEPIAEVSLVLQPHYYQSFWFRAAIVLIFFVVVFAICRVRKPSANQPEANIHHGDTEARRSTEPDGKEVRS
jgi:ligand-binding sensor domain-containing protein